MPGNGQLLTWQCGQVVKCIYIGFWVGIMGLGYNVCYRWHEFDGREVSGTYPGPEIIVLMKYATGNVRNVLHTVGCWPFSF
jgi:hypothetical protein